MPLPSAWEKIVGKPWSSLMPLAGTSSDNTPAPTTKRNGELVSPSSRRNHQNEKTSSSTATVESPPFILTHSKRLNRSDMTIFGLCPATERLALLPCSYCGDKFKCPALVDHIRLRHAGAKKPIAKCSVSSSPDKKKSPAHSGNRGRGGRFAKDKEKTVIEPAAPQVNQSDKSQEWTSKNDSKRNETPQRTEREIPVTSVLPQFLLKNSAETVKESSRNSKAKLRKLKQPQATEPPPSLYVIANSPPQLEKVAALPVLKSVVESSPGGRGSNKDKTKSETLSKKAKIDRNSEVEAGLLSPKIEKLDPADSELSHPPSEPPKLTQEVKSEIKTPVKTPETKRRKGQKGGNTRGGRIYDPDVHCGVITKDSSRPCTRALACKLHSIALRKEVKGRSRPFDVLLRREDVVDRSKTSMDVVDKNNSALDVDIVNSLINHPAGIKVSPELLSDFDVKPKISEAKSVDNNAKLSLPVSIKNLNLWSQLQQSPQQSDSTLPAQPVELENSQQQQTSPAVGLLNTFINNRHVKMEPSEDSSASAMPAPSSSRGLMHQHGNSQPLRSSSQPLRSSSQLPPGYRRAGSLLTTSLSVPRMFRDRARPKLNDRKAPPRTHLLGLKSGNVGLDSHTDFRKRLDLLKIPNKSVIAAMPNVAALVGSSSASGSQVVTVTKPLNLFGPLNGTTVLPLAIVQSTSSSSSASSSPAVVGILRDEVVRLEPPGTHFFTPSGPIAFTVDGTSSANQLAVRNPRLMAPGSSRGAPKPIAGNPSASGIVYLQRTLKTVH